MIAYHTKQWIWSLSCFTFSWSLQVKRPQLRLTPNPHIRNNRDHFDCFTITVTVFEERDKMYTKSLQIIGLTATYLFVAIQFHQAEEDGIQNETFNRDLLQESDIWPTDTAKWYTQQMIHLIHARNYSVYNWGWRTSRYCIVVLKLFSEQFPSRLTRMCDDPATKGDKYLWVLYDKLNMRLIAFCQAT